MIRARVTLLQFCRLALAVTAVLMAASLWLDSGVSYCGRTRMMGLGVRAGALVISVGPGASEPFWEVWCDRGDRLSLDTLWFWRGQVCTVASIRDEWRFPLWVPMFLFATPPCNAALRSRARARRTKTICCAHCGYQLIGLPANVANCPECGAAVIPAEGV